MCDRFLVQKQGGIPPLQSKLGYDRYGTLTAMLLIIKDLEKVMPSLLLNIWRDFEGK